MFQLQRTQIIPADLETCWDFFSAPGNLQLITPDYMGFHVRTKVPEQMYPGLIIAYTITPLLGIRMQWVTEITHVRDKEFFVDEQRSGPYRLWHHEHHFKAVEGGTEMTDILTYQLPLGFLGKLMHRFVVKKKLDEIFAYRFEKTKEIFG